MPGEAPVDSPDLIDRDFAADAPGQRLVGDITNLRTGEGWPFLATAIDLATRMVVGWQPATHMRTSLVVDALAMAIDAGGVQPQAIFHSDRGAQTGVNRSSQPWSVEPRIGARRGLRQVSSSRGSIGSVSDALDISKVRRHPSAWRLSRAARAR